MGVLFYVFWVLIVGACFILGPLILLLLVLALRGAPPPPTDGGERDGIPLPVLRIVVDNRPEDDPVRVHLVKRYPDLTERAA